MFYICGLADSLGVRAFDCWHSLCRRSAIVFVALPPPSSLCARARSTATPVTSLFWFQLTIFFFKLMLGVGIYWRFFAEILVSFSVATDSGVHCLFDQFSLNFVVPIESLQIDSSQFWVATNWCLIILMIKFEDSCNYTDEEYIWKQLIYLIFFYYKGEDIWDMFFCCR